MIPDTLKKPETLNLLFSGVIFLAGLVAYWFRPSLFRLHIFAERAFEFWVLKWMLFVVTWGLISANTDPRFSLATLDLNTIVGFGLVAALWKGDAYDERHTVVNLTFLFGLLFSWNFVAYSLVGRTDLWIFPSMTASLVYLASLSVVIILRYHSTGLLFAVISAAYLLLQMPTYHVVFISQLKTDPELAKWLAFGKLLYGVLFYGVFLSPIQNFESLKVPSLPLSVGGERLKRFASWAATAISAGVLTEIALRGGRLLWQLITGHPAG